MIASVLNDPVLIAMMTIVAGSAVAHAARARRLRPVRVERRNRPRPSVTD